MKRILVKPVGTEMGMNKAKHRVKALAETSVEIWKEKLFSRHRASGNETSDP